ncbi:hypothetical protein [Chryseobacterium sp. NKUCC03_KSP]|uniref:hypothetical protein n=1 Tax=Chryseobacterium sp. NKUCC03_KSP TaxID=2842125 RepID=UPI001C5B16C5|nr:hypothetical protein [Chryseobacterium sp. NKUCC03_KSP]MBW3524606.1 hypothetical protein [Chryseobacterium sp. NKUCC03_KSP]
MERFYTFLFKRSFLLLIVSFSYLSAQNMGSNDDFDGDGIVNSIDIDDDNDGILDAIEAPTNAINTVVNPTFNTDTSGWNLSLAWARYINTLAGRQNTISTVASASQSNIVLKNTCTNYAIYQLKIRTDNYIASSGAIVTESMSFGAYLGGVRLFGVTNPATSASPTITRDPAANGIITEFRVDGALLNASTAKSISLSAFHDIQISFNPAALPTTGNIEFRYTSTGDDILIDDVYYYINSCLDTDNDGIPNIFDLDSDGDGCPDALEAGTLPYATLNNGTYSSGTLVNAGGTTTTSPFAIVGNKTIPANYGINGFYNNIESNDTSTAAYTSSYTYDNAINNLKTDACKDTDGDNILDVFDIDDDNDGVLDEIECPAGFANLVNGGGFTTDPPTPNWYFANSTSNYDTPFIGFPFGYSGTQTNSPITGGLFDQVDGNNTNTSGYNALIEVNGTTDALVTTLNQTLVAGATYQFSYDAGLRGGSGAAGQNCTLQLYNADTNMVQSVLSSIPLTSLPSYPNYKTITGSFTVPVSGNYYLLFMNAGNGGAGNDYIIDRVAAIGSLNSSPSICDLDNDGIPNYLDLDTDGDGCPDTKEAILYNHPTEASIPGTVKNGSGGIVTSTSPNVPNAMVPGPYGSNGFADILQSGSNPDAYKYVYTYQFVATSSDINTCDNKFLYDIDSDDDGIPDAVESPSCFYTESQAMDITEGVTSDLAWAATNPLSNTYDNNTTNNGSIYAPTAVSIQNKALITFDLPVIDASLIDYVTLNVGVGFGAGKWKLQGLDMNSNTWTDLSATAGQAINSTTTFNNTLQPAIRYHSYRIIGIDNVNITNGAQLIEFTIHYKNYNPSLNRTKTGCNSDADGDGVPNYIDRDSDGDGCPDALEAGISKSLLVPANFFNTGGQVMGDHVVVGGNYGNNGMGDSVETAPDSGIINYSSTYTQYATNKTLNFCTDTDGDSVPDLIDLDDDNDGILDTTECTYPALPTTTSTADIFANWSNTTTAAGTNGAPTYLTSVGSWTAGAGLTAAISGGVINISNVNGSTLGDAFGANEYLEHPFTTTADNYNSLYYIRSSASNGTNYHWAMLISDDNFVTYTILNIDMLRNASGIIVNDINDYQLKPSTAYKVRTYYWGALAFTFDEFTMFGYSECDTDSDGVPNRLDLDSDGDGCTDALESGTVTQAGGNTSPGTVVNVSGSTIVPNAIIGDNAPVSYGVNGFYNGIESNDTATANYLGTYTYAMAINAAIASCTVVCYKSAAVLGAVLSTPQGITSLQRAGADKDNWPMIRKGAWTALESKTKGFIPNRLNTGQINSIPATDLREGMMVYNKDLDCMYINIDGTPTGWKCFKTQTCPN